MFPHDFFGLFPPFPREPRVFVAMSFSQAFHSRWEDVLVPAIESVKVEGVCLEPFRVDARRVSDSILTEILQGIANSRLFLADVTALQIADSCPIRNGNVMYEVGLAHAVRLPEEVLLFRSDRDKLLFDMANVRVNSYDPDGQLGPAREQVRRAIEEAIREIELKKHLSVKRAAEGLDPWSWAVLIESSASDHVEWPKLKTLGQVVAGMSRESAIKGLLSIGALTTSYAPLTRDIVGQLSKRTSAEEIFSTVMHYGVSPFGKAIVEYASEKLGIGPAQPPPTRSLGNSRPK